MKPKTIIHSPHSSPIQEELAKINKQIEDRHAAELLALDDVHQQPHQAAGGQTDTSGIDEAVKDMGGDLSHLNVSTEQRAKVRVRTNKIRFG